MKVLHITSRADHGGGGEHIFQLINACNKNFHGSDNSYVICPRDKPYWNKYSGIIVDMVSIKRRSINVIDLIRIILFIIDSNINIIHTHGKAAGVYGRLCKFFLYRKVKHIHTSHGIHIDTYKKMSLAFYKLYEFISSFLLDYVIFVSRSEQDKAYLNDIFKTVPSSIINNGVETDLREKYLPYKQKLFNRIKIPKRKVVITIARLAFPKNMIEMAMIAKELPNINFLWVGDGEEYESFLLHINSNQLDNIFLLGAVDDGKQYLSIADLYLSSSLSEGLPYSLLEAMSFGVPIVATNVEGHIDLIEDNITGLLYEVGDIDSAVAKIQKLLDDDNLYHEISMNQRYELSNEYSIDKMTKNIVSIYNKIMCLEV